MEGALFSDYGTDLGSGATVPGTHPFLESMKSVHKSLEGCGRPVLHFLGNFFPGVMVWRSAEVLEASRFLIQAIQLGLVENRGPGTVMELGFGWTPR